MTTAPADENCEACMFYIDGQCHRNPPSLWLPTTDYKAIDSETRITVQWPDVAMTDWCGEFRKAATAVPTARRR